MLRGGLCWQTEFLGVPPKNVSKSSRKLVLFRYLTNQTMQHRRGSSLIAHQRQRHMYSWLCTSLGHPTVRHLAAGSGYGASLLDCPTLASLLARCSSCCAPRATFPCRSSCHNRQRRHAGKRHDVAPTARNQRRARQTTGRLPGQHPGTRLRYTR